MESFAPPVSELAKLAVTRDPTPGQGLALDELGRIPQDAGLEPWHYVGQSGEPAFLNGWANIDVDRPARFYKDAFGIVYLNGIVKNGTLALAAFVLPDGYRPISPTGSAAGWHYPTVSNSAFGNLNITPNGAVIPSTGSNVWFGLECCFRAA